MSYTVTRHKHGIIFTGAGVPIDDMCALMNVYKKDFPIADAKIGEHLGAIMVLTSREKSEIWRKELGIGGEE